MQRVRGRFKRTKAIKKEARGRDSRMLSGQEVKVREMVQKEQVLINMIRSCDKSKERKKKLQRDEQ